MGGRLPGQDEVEFSMAQITNLAEMAPSPILEVDGVGITFGSLAALRDVSLSVNRGTVHAIIGPNGAGKTTLLNCLSGLYVAGEGSAVLSTKMGRNDLIGIKPQKVARIGMARTFQNIQLFGHLSVVDNLMLGRHVHLRPNLFGAVFRSPGWRKDDSENRERVEEIVDLLGLDAIRDTAAGSLAYGMQKQVELGRALCIEPELLLLDEPMAGTTASEREAMIETILSVKDSGVTISMIEHDMRAVMSMSDSVTVLSFGQVIADGTPEEVSADSAVIEAYLGAEDVPHREESKA